MTRPTNRDALLEDIRQERAALDAYLGSLGEDDLLAPDVVGEWSVKDVLSHLAAWEQLLLGWYEAGRRGEVPRTPAEDLGWSQLREVNRRIRDREREKPLDRVQAEYAASYEATLRVVDAMSGGELFGRGVYAWLKSGTLAGFVAACTSEHYAWARKEIRKGLRKPGVAAATDGSTTA
jgi:uncharacterized protein (TIGR03083 family)